MDGEVHLMPAGFDQALGRIRRSFRGRIGGLSPKQFIEVRRRRVRLSTHPRLIAVDCDALATHPDERVQTLALRIKQVRDRASVASLEPG
jgi:hypothetical protein